MHDILFNDRYRIPSTRLDYWDYGGSGPYFVTICTNGRYPFFGKIENGVMRLTPLGRIARQCWSQIPDHFPNVRLDESVIMPEHVHGIITINGSSDPITHNRFGPQSRNLGSIVRGYKIGVTKWARTNGHPFFMWQPRFHDHIIHDERGLDAVREYIRNNPLKTGLDG